AIANDPNEAELYFERGEAYRFHAEPAKALADYERALALAPGSDMARLGTGKALLELAKPAEAKLALNRFLDRCPANPEGLLARAQAHAMLKNTQAAVVDYDGALAAVSRPAPDIYLRRAAVLAADGCFAQAICGLDEGIRRLGHISSLELRALDY